MLAVVLLVAAVGLCATGTGGGPAMRGGAVLIAVVALAIPWLAPPVPLFRAVLGLAAAWHLARVIELAREPGVWTWARRLWHLVGVVDTRTLRPDVPRLDRDALLRVILGVCAMLGGWAVAEQLVLAGHTPSVLVRWGGALVLVYGLAEATFAFLRLAYAALGFRVPSIHDDPIASRTVREFWGERWNRVIGGWLERHGFLPLARAGHPRLGTLVAFVASALLHVHFTAAGAGWRPALWMGAFFVIQGLVVVAERVLRVDRWPSLVARVWTVLAIVAPSPLFLEPLLQIVPP